MPFDLCLFIHLFSFFPPVAICSQLHVCSPPVSPAAAWSSYQGKIRFLRTGLCTTVAMRTSRPTAARSKPLFFKVINSGFTPVIHHKGLQCVDVDVPRTSLQHWRCFTSRAPTGRQVREWRIFQEINNGIVFLTIH